MPKDKVKEQKHKNITFFTNDLLQFPQRLAKTVPTTYQYVNPYYKNVQDC